MNKISTLLLITVTVLSLSLTVTKSKAEEKSFMGVLPFVTTTDRMGFLDQRDGKIYIYDSNIHQCLFVGQIHKLGEPIEAVFAHPAHTNL
jgi:hypothetical protein